MDSDEQIQGSYSISVERSEKIIFYTWNEGMLILTDKHLMFVNKTEAKVRWWNAATQRQVLIF